MLGTTFRYDLIRKYTIAFGALFTDVWISRKDKTGNILENIKVPLSYSNKDKMLARVDVQQSFEPDKIRPIAISLPRMGFEIVNYTYDPDRKLASTQKIIYQNPTDHSIKYQYMPVPYNIDFSLYVLCKNIEDGTQIVEQILPFFQPEWQSTIELVPEINYVCDIPIIIKNIECTDKYDGQYEQRRYLAWTINFTMKAWLFGPTRTSGLIKYTTTNYRIPSTNTAAEGIGNTEVSEYVEVYPGLTSNGQPTSNAALTIPYSDIFADDDYGIIETIHSE